MLTTKNALELVSQAITEGKSVEVNGWRIFCRESHGLAMEPCRYTEPPVTFGLYGRNPARELAFILARAAQEDAGSYARTGRLTAGPRPQTAANEEEAA